MTFLNGTLAQLNQEKTYHEQQVQSLEAQIDNVRVAQEYGEIATASVSEAIDNIDPEHLQLLKEHLLSLFSGEIETPSYTYSQDIVEPIIETEEEVIINSDEDEDDSTTEHLSDQVEQGIEEQEEETTEPESISVTSDIVYNSTESICYIGFTAKGRANNYGDYLTRVYDVASKYKVNHKPTVITDSKYELILQGITREDTEHLANFNLKLEYDHPDHKEFREVWDSTRKKELPPPYKPSLIMTPIEEIEIGEIVCSDSSGGKQYKVLNKTEIAGRPHLEVIATYNSEFPQLEGKTSFLGEAYRLPIPIREEEF